MEFLKQCGYNDVDIKEIIDNNYPNIIENLVINQEKVLDIIYYLIEIGITIQTIKEIFIYQIGLFFKAKSEIKNSFEEYEIDSIAKSLNYDVNNIELIDFI